MSTYAISDLHGRYDLWNHLSKNFFEEDDTIYFLGDAADRGSDGWLLIKELLNDKRVIYIKGNHEDLLVNAWESIDSHTGISYNSEEAELLFYNGGKKTLEDLLKESYSEQKYYIDKLKELPLIKRYINGDGDIFDMCHAGFSYNAPAFDFLWDRSHFYDEWPGQGFENHYIVHGHTPLQTLFGIDSNSSTQMQYCGNHKINLDCYAVGTNVIGVLDLDRHEVFTIEVKNNER